LCVSIPLRVSLCSVCLREKVYIVCVCLCVLCVCLCVY
jgi:hypothetical protein